MTRRRKAADVTHHGDCPKIPKEHGHANRAGDKIEPERILFDGKENAREKQRQCKEQCNSGDQCESDRQAQSEAL
jgi:hypothetical protein